MRQSAWDSVNAINIFSVRCLSSQAGAVYSKAGIKALVQPFLTFSIGKIALRGNDDDDWERSQCI
jgi:hypothetical protein